LILFFYVIFVCHLLQDSGNNKIVMDDWIVFMSSKHVAHLVKVIILIFILLTIICQTWFAFKFTIWCGLAIMAIL